MSKKVTKSAKPAKNVQITLRSLLSLVVGAAMFLTILAVGGTAAYMSYTSALSAAEDSVENIALMSMYAVENKIMWIKSDVEAIANANAVKLPESTTEEKLQRLSEENQRLGYSSTGFIEPSGYTLAAVGTEPTNLSERDYFKKSINGETYITTPFYSEALKSMVITVSAPVIYNGKITGVVYAILPSNTISAIVADAVLAETGYIYLVDDNGVIVAHPNEEYVNTNASFIEIGKTDPANFGEVGAAMSVMVKEDSGIQYYKNNGVKRIVGFDSLSNKWTVLASIPLSEIIQSTLNAIFVIVLISVVALIITIVVMSMFAKSLSLPLSNAANRLQALTQGDLRTPVQTSTSKTEIGLLTRGLEQMITWLQSIITELTTVLSSVAGGDLTAQVSEEYLGDFAVIKTSLVTICASLNETLGAIKVSGEQVNSGAAQVSGAAQALSQGATEQASSIQELSSTIAEVSDNINRSAENSKRASSLAEVASDEVEKGNQQMTEMLTAMEEINAASTQISQIIKVIDNIAFQTNILALNAAVEAARAGAAGKGFAVVADEVRNLAGKSAEAAKQTTALIEGSVAAVQRGSAIAEKTALSLSAIAGETKEITRSIEEISTAASEQATAATQIALGMDQISSVVQTNSATAEESAAASEELSGQAAMLREQISKFKLTDGAGTGLLGSPSHYTPKISGRVQSNGRPTRLSLDDNEKY